MKTCQRCRQLKEASGFNQNRSRNDGLHNWCKACVRAYSRDPAVRNRDKKWAEKTLSLLRLRRGDY